VTNAGTPWDAQGLIRQAQEEIDEAADEEGFDEVGLAVLVHISHPYAYKRHWVWDCPACIMLSGSWRPLISVIALHVFLILDTLFPH